MDTIRLFPIGSIQGQGAEISAYDPTSKRLFVTAGEASVQVLDISNPTRPSILQTLDFSAFGSGVNSVATKNGLLAVAVEAEVAQDPGKVVFLDVNGNFLKEFTVGALPDMVTFTPDGKKVLTANEAEPNQEYTVDPEGSISIIDLTNGLTNATVSTADFKRFIGQEEDLRAEGIRIFGPNANAAQDFEPEYITVSDDSKTAWVTLQENNAFAIVDIPTATVTDVVPLGFKDHNSTTVVSTQTYEFDPTPKIGTTLGGQDIFLGGFSGLFFEGYTAAGNLKFITHTDRGPNGEPTGSIRPFLLPEFTPQVVRFELNQSSGKITITEQIQLKDAQGELLTGLPNTAIASGTGNTPYNDEIPVDLLGNRLPLDPLGADLEGIVVAEDGSFWMVDEYRPAIYHFDADGTLIERFVPQGTAAAAGQPVGTFGTEALPAILAQRRQNRGFEAVAYQDGKLYAFVQSPLRNPTNLSNNTLNGLQNIRIVEFDPATETTRQFLYVLDNPPATSSEDTRADKIGDAVAIGNGQFLVIERDDDAIDSDPIETIQKKVYRFSLENATEISSLSGSINLPDGVTKTVDQMTVQELASIGVTPIQKALHVDLAKAGYNTVEKVEGLALVDANTIAVINDNDFQVAGITIDPTTGTFTPDPDAEPIVLGLIKTNPNGLDASDRDGRINIRNWPVFGMYQPDAIASFVVNGQTFLITANEGDSRDFEGFSEEVRVGNNSYQLDPIAFPNAAELKQNANLGRLTVTNTLGDTDGDGKFEEIYAFGARSFSIWDAQGRLVYDSADDFEQITASLFPTLFNSESTPDSFDTRSDNKGPEPEGVAVGVINGRTYAFIGLERIGGVMVYDVSNPTAPSFVQYINYNSNFGFEPGQDFSPEGVLFISAADSPTGRPLVAVTNEVSGTTTLFEAGKPIEGTTGNDQLVGTNKADFIFGFAGNDRIFAQGGDDRIAAGDGNDEVTGDAGDDIIYGGAGNDTLNGGAGRDQIYGEAGNDLIFGGSGNNELWGGTGNDTIYGNGGLDTINGGNGDNLIYGGSQADIITTGSGNDTIYGNGGADVIVTGAGDDVVWLGSGAATIRLEQGAGFDTINNFNARSTKFQLDGLTFEELKFTGVRGDTQISFKDDVLAVVKWNSVSTFTNNPGLFV
jgi:hypothetical protein